MSAMTYSSSTCPSIIHDDYMLADLYGGSHDDGISEHSAPAGVAFDTSAQHQLERSNDDSILAIHSIPTSPVKLKESFLHSLFTGSIVKKRIFRSTVIVLIIANSILLGIGTYPFVMEHEDIDEVVEVIDKVFLILFTVELAMNFRYHGIQKLFRNSWLTFDFWVVVLSWAFSALQIIRTVRILRAARLISQVSDLKELVVALMGVIPKMIPIAVLLVLIFYIFGVMFTMLYHNAYENGATELDYFSTLDKTFLTLFQITTQDGWSSITRDLIVAYPLAWIPVLSFVLISSFVVINLVIAVICDAVAGMYKEERAKDMGRIENFVEQYSSLSPQHDDSNAAIAEINRLERKVDALTALMEELLQEKKQATK
jgi:Ion transport protein